MSSLLSCKLNGKQPRFPTEPDGDDQDPYAGVLTVEIDGKALTIEHGHAYFSYILAMQLNPFTC